ncbi:hypothetical protein [Flammeovirga kamogawensis]|uniref:Uncharacterized protein n=1 Tax=Flammeovirga kamogawensis TaxID=373891 RepID=A0ABX8H4N0_9BACT|nr:hypothetical protein [Flammeovirga kamogawensis]MBB6463841.1 hypothetical protein [Flammeovirga kamogawensis]QWG10766.1 hypothetical protein KM029_26770 [Flammeovirga kamogawensis]TRX63248.1 hypothetical protein EO216_26705 [Flammeovirga kamogawensis]
MQSIHFSAIEQIGSRIIPYVAYAVASYQHLKSKTYKELKTPGNVWASEQIGFTPESSDMPLARDLALYYFSEMKSLFSHHPIALLQAKKTIAFTISLHRIELERKHKAAIKINQMCPLPVPEDYKKSEVEYSNLPF